MEAFRPQTEALQNTNEEQKQVQLLQMHRVSNLNPDRLLLLILLELTHEVVQIDISRDQQLRKLAFRTGHQLVDFRGLPESWQLRVEDLYVLGFLLAEGLEILQRDALGELPCEIKDLDFFMEFSVFFAGN